MHQNCYTVEHLHNGHAGERGMCRQVPVIKSWQSVEVRLWFSYPTGRLLRRWKEGAESTKKTWRKLCELFWVHFVRNIHCIRKDICHFFLQMIKDQYSEKSAQKMKVSSQVTKSRTQISKSGTDTHEIRAWEKTLVWLDTPYIDNDRPLKIWFY